MQDSPCSSAIILWCLWGLESITRSVYIWFIFSSLSPQQQGLGWFFIYLSTESWDSSTLFLGWCIVFHCIWNWWCAEVFQKTVSFSALIFMAIFSIITNSSTSFLTTSSGYILFYWFYQCYKACHIPTPTHDSHNHIAIGLLRQLTVRNSEWLSFLLKTRNLSKVTPCQETKLHPVHAILFFNT